MNRPKRFEFTGELRDKGLQNISMTGLFLSTASPLELGSFVDFSLRNHSEQAPLRLKGTVARVVEAGEPEGPGMGIQFAELGPYEKKQLADLIIELGGDPGDFRFQGAKTTTTDAPTAVAAKPNPKSTSSDEETQVGSRKAPRLRSRKNRGDRPDQNDLLMELRQQLSEERAWRERAEEALQAAIVRLDESRERFDETRATLEATLAARPEAVEPDGEPQEVASAPPSATSGPVRPSTFRRLLEKGQRMVAIGAAVEEADVALLEALASPLDLPSLLQESRNRWDREGLISELDRLYATGLVDFD